MTDFEVAALNMFNDKFPFANLVGCYFHFSRCIYMRIHANGLSQRYRTDEVFALQARMIAALAFVPPDDVVDYFSKPAFTATVDFEEEKVQNQEVYAD